MIQAIQHAGAVLALFTAERPEWGASTVARVLGVSKSAAHNMLVSLTAAGLLRRVPQGHYRLGWRAVEMAEVIAATDEVVAACAPVMAELVRACGAPVALAAGPRAQVLAVTDGRGTYVGGCTWFSRSAILGALGRADPVRRPFAVRDGDLYHVAMEVEHGRSGARLVLATSLPAIRADRSMWIVAAAAKLAHRLRDVLPAHDDPAAELV
jgi:predicted transcriptional regulator